MRNKDGPVEIVSDSDSLKRLELLGVNTGTEPAPSQGAGSGERSPRIEASVLLNVGVASLFEAILGIEVDDHNMSIERRLLWEKFFRAVEDAKDTHEILLELSDGETARVIK